MHQGQKRHVFRCGREISFSEMEEVREKVATFQRLSRTELAMTICEHPGWYSVTGSPKVDACLKLLNKLESQGVLSLPTKHAVSAVEKRRPDASARTVPQAPIECQLKELFCSRNPEKFLFIE